MQLACSTVISATSLQLLQHGRVPPLVPKGHHGSPRSVHEVLAFALTSTALIERPVI